MSPAADYRQVRELVAIGLRGLALAEGTASIGKDAREKERGVARTLRAASDLLDPPTEPTPDPLLEPVVLELEEGEEASVS